MTNIIVTGTFIDAQENPVNGRATFTPVVAGPTTVGTLVGEPIPVAIIGGALSVELITTDSFLTVSGQVSYRVYIKTGSVRQTYYVVLPSTLGATVDIEALLKFEVPPDVVIDPEGGTSGDPEVAQLQATVEALQDQIDAQQTQLDALSGSISGFDAQIDLINTALGAGIAGVEASLSARLDAIEAQRLDDYTLHTGTAAALDARLDTAESKLGNARLFSATSYPPAGYTAQNGDVWVDTTP